MPLPAPVISTGAVPSVTVSQPLGSSALTGPPLSVLIFMGASHMCASFVVKFVPEGSNTRGVSQAGGRGVAWIGGEVDKGVEPRQRRKRGNNIGTIGFQDYTVLNLRGT